MSDDTKKDAPVEGRTQAFRVKIDGWMSELIGHDFDLEESPAAAPEAPPAGSGGPAPSGPPATK